MPDKFGFDFAYKWIGKNLPERIGQRCQVRKRFGFHVSVEFKDGFRIDTSCKHVERTEDPGLAVVGGTP